MSSIYICNLVAAIKNAKHFEFNEKDVIFMPLTDAMKLYGSRLEEMHAEHGKYSDLDAAAHFARYLQGVSTDHLIELSYTDRRRIHNLKYFTWVEQQGKTYEEILAQWYEQDYWTEVQSQVSRIDDLITEFNKEVGLI